VRCTRAAHNDGEDIYQCALPVAADGVCKGGVFGTYEVRCLRDVIVRAVLPFPYLNLFYGSVTAATVCVTDEARFEEADEVGFVCGGS
jgi:hypothetical protein